MLCSLTITSGVAALTLHRPAARNALSLDLLVSLHEQLDALARECLHPTQPGGPPRVVVLQGEGSSFCAGMDLKAVLGDAAAPIKLLSTLAEATLKLRNLPCVSVAKVRGAAIGGGCGLACVTDICITHADSKMGYPEVDLGVCPAVVAPWLAQKVGMGRARRILLMGGLLTGSQAKDLGMVDELVATADELDAATAAIAQRLAQGGPHALAATKTLLNDLEGSLLSTPTTSGAMRRDTSNETDFASRLTAAVREGAKISATIVNTPQTQETLRARLK
jgi:enoyl-CoA hydratase/carnithine racemase